MSRFRDEIMSDLSDSERRIVDAITFRMDELLLKMEEKDKVIDKLNNDVFVLKATVSRLEDKIDQNDAFDRRETLVFSGKSLPIFSNNENVTQVLNKVLKDKLKLPLPENSIATSHRVGKIPVRGEDRRAIVARFCNRDMKIDIMKAAKTVKPENLFINESLTPVRQTIHYVLRKAKKKFPEKISGISTFDGKIMVYVKPLRPSRNSRDIKFIINSRSKLETFCNDALATSLTSLFDGEWQN